MSILSSSKCLRAKVNKPFDRLLPAVLLAQWEARSKRGCVLYAQRANDEVKGGDIHVERGQVQCIRTL
jgi:hypothetical protein